MKKFNPCIKINFYKIRILILIPIAILLCDFASAQVDSHFISCQNDEKKYKQRSDELQEIVASDQEDRKETYILKPEIQFKDLKRRFRVGEIFAEGCFKNAKDFAAAALVFQHGNVSEHYFQAFIWAKRAVELGDESQKNLMAEGLDRYLVSLGHKQLFATQATKKYPDKCFCLRATEESFPESLRIEYTHKTVQDQLKWIDTINDGQGCNPSITCKQDSNLFPSPAGTVPGFW